MIGWNNFINTSKSWACFLEIFYNSISPTILIFLRIQNSTQSHQSQNQSLLLAGNVSIKSLGLIFPMTPKGLEQATESEWFGLEGTFKDHLDPMVPT